MNTNYLPEGIDMYLSNGLLPLYYFVVIICMGYIYYRFKFDKLVLFFIYVFSEGMFSYIGYELPIFNRVYKLGFLLFALYLFYNNVVKQKANHFKSVFFLVIILIGILFAFNSYINNQDFIITLSQFQKKVIPFLFLFGAIKLIRNKFDFYMDAMLWILGVQFIFALVKLAIWGFGESLVGSITFNGGGASNVLPVIAFFLIWMKKEGNLRAKDWLYLLMVFSVSIIGDKRSIIFIFPTVIILTMVLSNKFKVKDLLRFSIVGLFCLYVAVKLNPSLNPEQVRWGSFDPEFFVNYLVEYTYGDNKASVDEDVVQGRGAASQALVAKLISTLDFKDISFYIGDGFSMIDTDYENFDNDKYGLISKGSASGFVQTFIAYGLLGLLLFLYFGFLSIKFNKNKSVKWVLFIFVIWDMMFFYYTSINTYAFSIAIIFIGIYSYRPKLKQKYSPNQL